MTVTSMSRSELSTSGCRKLSCNTAGSEYLGMMDGENHPVVRCRMAYCFSNVNMFVTEGGLHVVVDSFTAHHGVTDHVSVASSVVILSE